ncbi:MAG: 16S rRNA (guanine(527)-N(7))-methyltransferase RsmG [Lentisphaerae bacterium]|nr:16S rRNA (guanine(527)-N(7))-methyltransferase RsmG [Lentisphaerota bacterium]
MNTPPADFISFIHSVFIPDPDKFISRCIALHEYLTECNKHVNLTRLISVDDFYFKHIADSLSIATVFPEIASGKLSVADIGCGAGFPSLVLAAAFPNLQITAIDSIGKKIKFVADAAQLLQLNNLTALHGRSVELNCRKEFQYRFDIVTARAVAPSPKICKEASNFPKHNGKFIFYKTPAQAAEESQQLAEMKNFSWQNTPVFSLPSNAGERLFTIGVRRSK